MSDFKRVVLVNGVDSPNGTVVIDAADPGFTLGMSVFETLRTYGGGLFDVESHLERLAASAFAMGLAEPALDQVLDEMVQAANRMGGEAMVRVTLTPGGTRVVEARSVPLTPKPFRCVTREFVPPAWLDGTVKHGSRAFSRRAVLSAGVDEVVWVDEGGFILEGTRSNVFVVSKGVLVTPPVDGRILAGVTRMHLIDLADELGIPVEIRPVHTDATVDEFYVSSTLKELTAVDEIDGAPAAGRGPVGDRLMSEFSSWAGAHCLA